MVSALGSRVSSLALCVLGAILCSGCYDLKKQDPGIELTPDENGWVSVPEYGIQGHWFTYGDQYGVPARCVTLGRHVAESCSTIVSDDLQGLPKPLNGKMCITGQAAEVGKCVKPDWVECLKPRSAQ